MSIPDRGPWRLADLADVEPNGYKVFSCFHCGGGSTMGYKLAGFDVMGGVEIDPEMMKLYRQNHRPRLSFLMGIEEFNKIQSLPEELTGLDILDGSPPCSSFSMAGSREDTWGKKKKFREGQAEQVLDDLFFRFIETAERLQPKVVIAENVKGMLAGNARGYVRMVLQGFEQAGYDVQLFLLDASRMSVPQRRERVFFVAKRKDLPYPRLDLSFNDPAITVGDAFEMPSGRAGGGEELSEKAKWLWMQTYPGDSFAKINDGSWFNWIRLHAGRPAPTMPATCRLVHFREPRMISYAEAARIQTFPDDYDFMDADARYVCGMSVPPRMMQRIAREVRRQWLDSVVVRRPTDAGRTTLADVFPGLPDGPSAHLT